MFQTALQWHLTTDRVTQLFCPVTRVSCAPAEDQGRPCLVPGRPGPASSPCFVLFFQRFRFGFPQELPHSACLVLVKRHSGSVLYSVLITSIDDIAFSPSMPRLLDRHQT